MNDKQLTIYDIKRLTKKTAPYFFDKETMSFFGQTMGDFKISLLNDGKYRISAPSGNYETVRIFNPINNQLENE
tara:strand:- start:609 stop:830 length:222 start_codon:yes stop_codon:yes gene_type:complete